MKKFKMAFKLKLLSRDDLTFKIFSWLIFTLKVAKEKESVTRIEKIDQMFLERGAVCFLTSSVLFGIYLCWSKMNLFAFIMF